MMYAKRYICRAMQSPPAQSHDPARIRLIAPAVIGGLVVIAGMAGMVGWLANGDSLLWSMMQSGLAWCM